MDERTFSYSRRPTLNGILEHLKGAREEAYNKKMTTLHQLDENKFATESEKQTTFFAHWRAVGQEETCEKCLQLLAEFGG